MTSRRPASAGTTTALGALAATHLAHLVSGRHDSYLSTLLVATIVLLVATIIASRAAYSLEAGVGAAVLALGSLAATMLACCVGLPGRAPEGPDLMGVVTAVASGVALVLLARDARREPTYAL